MEARAIVHLRGDERSLFLWLGYPSRTDLNDICGHIEPQKGLSIAKPVPGSVVVPIQIGITRSQIRVLWRAPQNPKSWISKALCAFEIQLLEKLGGLCDLLRTFGVAHSSLILLKSLC
jgi:hypothetical protein